MKVYAREALEQYGKANYVLSEDRFVEDSGTGEIFNIPEDMIDTPEQLVRRLQKGTLSLESKFYPSKSASNSLIPIVTNNYPSFKKLPKSSVDELSDRLQLPTFSRKLHQANLSGEPGVHVCELENWRLEPHKAGKRKPGVSHDFKPYGSVSTGSVSTRSTRSGRYGSSIYQTYPRSATSTMLSGSKMSRSRAIDTRPEQISIQSDIKKLSRTESVHSVSSNTKSTPRSISSRGDSRKSTTHSISSRGSLRSFPSRKSLQSMDTVNGNLKSKNKSYSRDNTPNSSRKSISQDSRSLASARTYLESKRNTPFRGNTPRSMNYSLNNSNKSMHSGNFDKISNTSTECEDIHSKGRSRHNSPLNYSTHSLGLKYGNLNRKGTSSKSMHSLDSTGTGTHISGKSTPTIAKEYTSRSATSGKSILQIYQGVEAVGKSTSPNRSWKKPPRSGVSSFATDKREHTFDQSDTTTVRSVYVSKGLGVRRHIRKSSSNSSISSCQREQTSTIYSNASSRSITPKSEVSSNVSCNGSVISVGYEIKV